MPREVKAYACSFGCGRRVQTSKKPVEKHEKTCAMNPERRACKVCVHKYNDSDESPACHIGKLQSGVLMRFDCEFFEESFA